MQFPGDNERADDAGEEVDLVKNFGKAAVFAAGPRLERLSNRQRRTLSFFVLPGEVGR